MEKVDYLDVDNPIPGQNYTCISFVSPDETMKQKELFLFNKYMNQRCGELENEVSEVIKKCSDELKNKIERDIVEKLRLEMKYTYNEFKSKYDDFRYKYNDELNDAFEKISDKKTSIRGVKVRGCYDSYDQAERRAKALQRTDRSFHVFVGQVGYWLPWDPNADQVQDEEYLEGELNTLMQEYKKNEINRDIFYEDQKREKLKDAERERMAAESGNKIEEVLDEADPWMNSKFKSSKESTDTTEDGEGVATEDGEGVATEDGGGVATEDGEGVATEDGEGVATEAHKIL
jgi:hypothetical protein